MKIEKVDAHHHLWAMNSSHYPMMTAPDTERFIGNTGRLKHDFGAAEFLTLAANQNVIRSVYVESHFTPPLEETAHVQAIALEHGFPNAIMGRADLASPDLGRDLDIHMRAPLFRGLRAMVNWDDDPKLCSVPQDGLLRNAQWRWGYKEVGVRGLVAEVMALPAQLGDLARLAEEAPETSLVVGHTGMPFRRTANEDSAWREGMAALAAMPHVSVKISGLGMPDHHWSVASIRPLVEETIAFFGPSRCMFASNFPVDGLYSSYDQLWDAFDHITAGYAPADRSALFRDTAIRVFRID